MMTGHRWVYAQIIDTGNCKLVLLFIYITTQQFDLIIISPLHLFS